MDPLRSLRWVALAASVLAGSMLPATAADYYSLKPGQKFNPGDNLLCSGRSGIKATLSEAGRLTIYVEGGRVRWEANDRLPHVSLDDYAYLEMQKDGNLTIFHRVSNTNFSAIWTARAPDGRAPFPGAELKLDSNANLVIYNPNKGQDLWWMSPWQ